MLPERLRSTQTAAGQVCGLSRKQAVLPLLGYSVRPAAGWSISPEGFWRKPAQSAATGHKYTPSDCSRNKQQQQQQQQKKKTSNLR